MVLTHPDFTVTRPAGLADEVTDAEWWIWLRLHELEPTSELGGFLAWKSGFHSTGSYNQQKYPGNYSIRDQPNRTGPWWLSKCSALDWTFPEAQRGNYARIIKYTQRLLKSAKDPNDPRLDLVLYEFFGQADQDTSVEGYSEYKEADVTSDPSHLWHLHMSFLRNKCGDFWAMWALLTVLMGWTVAQWRASIGGGTTPPPATGGIEMFMIQTKGQQAVVVSTSCHYRGIDYPTFRLYTDVLHVPFTLVESDDALAAAGGKEITGSMDVVTLDQATMDRIHAYITEHVGTPGVAAGTIDAETLRRLVDDESVSFEELAGAVAAGNQAQVKEGSV